VIEGLKKFNDDRTFIKTVSAYTLIVCLILSFLVFPFSHTISLNLFGNLENVNLLRLLPVMILSIAYNLLIRSIYISTGYLAQAGIVMSLSYLFMFVVSLFSTELVDIYLYGSLACVFISVITFKDRKLLFPSFTFGRIKSFEKTAISTSITGVTGFLSFLIVRSICLKELGAENGGFLEASWSLVNYTTLIFLAGLGSYYLPQVSERPEDIEFRKKFFLIINAGALTSLLILCFGKSLIIPLLFSQEFLPTSSLLDLMSVGEYLRCINFFFVFSLIGMTQKKAYIVLDTAANISFVLIALIFPVKDLQTFGFIYVAYQILYLLGSIALNSKYKMIPNKLLGLNLILGLSLWTVYFLFF